jgi:RNA-directed DNA polymerase
MGKSFAITQAEVLAAYKRVKTNRGAGGVDGVDLEKFEKRRDDNLYKLWNRMASGSYVPKPVRGVEIPKKNGKKRLLGIPTIEDRVAQMVVRQRLEPLLESIFLPDSYGYRPSKSAIDAVGKVRERCWQYPWVIEFDIKGLFDNINHEKLMKAVRKHTNEKWVLMYTERFLKAPVIMPDSSIQERTSGTPQGGVISPVLANLFMHYAFDVWMVKHMPRCPWERYADDGIIHCMSYEEAERVLKSVEDRMRQCELELHPDKTRIVYCHSRKFREHHKTESFDFLGYTFMTRYTRRHGGDNFKVFTPAVSKDAAKRFRAKIKEAIRNTLSWDIEVVAARLNPIIRGWTGYFGCYRKSELSQSLCYVNATLVRWCRRKYKSVHRSMSQAWVLLQRIALRTPDLFHHWTMRGYRPTMKIGRAV